MVSRFAVLGSPISHSQSPALHRAAISILGIDATYDAHEVFEGEFTAFLNSRAADEVGFSLTMPLKQVVRPLLVSECATSTLTGSVNTIVRQADGWHGFNTDVIGAELAIRSGLGSSFATATILGAGATAASVVVALSKLGVGAVTVLVRDVARATSIAALAERLGMSATVSTIGTSVQNDILINTLPGSVQLSVDVIDDLDAGALLDVVYSPWPTGLAREFTARGFPVVSGLSMLLWQAVHQARVFYGDGVDEPLPNESLVVTAMRSAVGL